MTITGTLNEIDGGLATSGPLAGTGYFLAFKLTSPDWNQYTSVKVGLDPSASGMELVEILTDPDKNGVFKITPNLNQKFKMVTTDKNGVVETVEYDTTTLTFED